MLHRHVGLVRAVHAEHADKMLVGAGKPPRPIRVLVHGKAEQAHQLGELRRRVGQDHAAAGIDHRALGLDQQLHRLLDLARMPLHHRIVRAHRDRFGIFELALGDGHILRNIHQHRPRSPGGRKVESLLDGSGKILDVFDQEIVFDAGAGDTDRVAFLERIQADRVRGHLAGDDHHRDRIHIRGGDAGDGIGHART